MAREYNLYSRKKLPRNKYGLLDTDYSSSSSSVFGSSNSDIGSTSIDVGAVMNALPNFGGATETVEGTRGIVPAPGAGMQNFFLQGNGAWTKIPAFEWMSEFPVGDGFEKTGLQVNGDLRVTDTLSVLNLEVEGAAHFWSLIIDEVKSTGGQLLVSPSSFTVDWIGDIYYWDVFDPKNQYTLLLQSRDDIRNALSINNIKYFKCRRLYQRNDDTSKKTFNEVVVGDMLRCRQFNIEEGTKYENVKNDDWWSFVARVGEEEYTDNLNRSYSAFFIDLVYALEKIDGTTVPLSSVLSTVEDDIEYPSYWNGDIYSDELKRLSQKTLDGTTNVEREYYDTEEWKDVVNNVIQIRGIDDSVNALVGEEGDGEINTSNLDTVDSILSTIADGTTSTAPKLSASDYVELIQHGNISTNNIEENTEDAIQITEGILSDRTDVENTRNLIQERVKFEPMYFSPNTTTQIPLYAAERMTVTIDSTDSVIEKGEEIPSGAVIKDGGYVVEGLDSTIYKKYDTDQSEEDAVVVSGEELDTMVNGSDTTAFGTDKDVSRESNYKYDERESWVFGYGEFSVKIGDSLACLGHLYLPDRQNAIVISATNPIDPELEAPAMAQYNNIDTFGESISRYRMTAIAANGNEFIGSFLVNYNNSYLDINDRINIFVNDIKTGLETVGIHLDGDKSTITLVGNIDIRQHSSSSWDSINLYDNKEVKRLEISPFEIPKRNSSSFGSISKKKFYINSSSNTTTIPSQYISVSHWKDWDGPFYYHWVYSFTMNDYQLSISHTINLGNVEAGYDIDLGNIELNPYFPSYVSDDRFIGEYRVSNIKVFYTLKNDGRVITGHNNKDVTSYFTLSTTDVGYDYYLRSTGNIIDDLHISTSGNISITFKVLFNVYMYARKNNSGYNNTYITSYLSLFGNGELTLAPSASSSSNSDTSLRKMNIGTNGFSFVGNNSRYFYAATDGIEMKWDNVSIGIDPSVGIKMQNRVYTSAYIIQNNNGITPADTDIIITSNPSTSSTITLYNGNVDLGSGKRITIIDCQKLTINNLAHPKTEYAIDYESRGEDGMEEVTRSIVRSVRSFIWYNSEWYEI